MIMMQQIILFLLVVFLTAALADYTDAYSGNYMINNQPPVNAHGYGYRSDPLPGFQDQLLFLQAMQSLPNFKNLQDGYLTSLKDLQHNINYNFDQLQRAFQNQIDTNMNNLFANGYIPETPKPLGDSSYSAGASAAINGDSVYQSAFLYPENPMQPNINVRYGAAPATNGKSYSISTSSSSGSGNVNGQPYGYRRAQTVVNDNGKITTYTLND